MEMDATKADVSREAPPGPGPHVELARGKIIDRYVVLGRLGAGGMGVVYSAYDPELDRKVALKFVRAGRASGSGSSGEARTRMVREAQALARLNHGNVVAVYDVGSHDEDVWLAMELVEGQTLGAWCAQGSHGWREVLDVLISAGHGLAAAHAAGIVHRDFKPDNVMVGSDGRVRVMDLGLALWSGDGTRAKLDLHDLPVSDTDVRPELAALAMRVTQKGAVIGTPFYMAPEQFQGKDVGAAADVFAYCVTAWEALHGERPYAGDTFIDLLANVLAGKPRPAPRGKRVPAWVRRVLERGLLRNPADRWPSMPALLAALSHDPRRARRRGLALAAAVVGMAAIGYGVATIQGGAAMTCRGAAEELATVWNPQRQADVEQAVRATGVEYADGALTVTVEYLNTFADQWVAAHTESCEAYQRGALSAPLFDRRMACLRQRRVELDATAGVLAQTTRATVAQVIETASGLPAVAHCADDERLLASVPPPDDPAVARKVEQARETLARLQAMERSGLFTQALAEVLPLIPEAERLGYAPLLIEEHLLAGTLSMHALDHENAKRYFDAAISEGIPARFDEPVAEALAKRMFVMSQIGQSREALEQMPIVRAFVERVGSPPVLAALFHNCLGVVYSDLGDFRQAIEENQATIDLLTEHAPDNYLRWASVNNLTIGLQHANRSDEAEKLLGETLEVLEKKHIVCHPHIEVMRMEHAAIRIWKGQMDEGFAQTERALACWGSEYPGYSIFGLLGMGAASLVRGDSDARSYLRRAEVFLQDPRGRTYDVNVEFLRAAVEIHEGRLDEAQLVLSALSMRQDLLPEPFRFPVETQLGVVAHRRHDDALALEHFERAMSHSHGRIGHDDRGLYSYYRARTMHALGHPLADVRAEAQRAVDEYDAAGVIYAGRAAEIRAWLAQLPAGD